MVETKNKIAIIGLGYVGLPLAVEFAKKYKTVGYDIDLERISELRLGKDKTLEIKQDDLRSVSMSDYKVFNESLVGFWATNEIIDRELNNDEYAIYQAEQAERAVKKAEAEAKAQAKATAEGKLAALGLTTDDLRALGL